jgi:hypothetical protein
MQKNDYWSVVIVYSLITHRYDKYQTGEIFYALVPQHVIFYKILSDQLLIE